MARRVVAQGYGGPDQLALVEYDAPDPGPGEVRVDLRAIGVNPFDLKSYSGAFGTDPGNLPVLLGGEAAGVVSAVGTEANSPTGLVAVGDEVVVFPGRGLYADQVTVPVSSVLAKPSGVAWEVAAGLLLAGATAFDTLDTVGVGPGDTLLLHGASGAVGSAAIQLAVGRGATVVGTASAENQEYVRELGAIPVGYGPGLVDRVRALAPDGVSAAIDAAGTDEALDVSAQLVPERGRIVTIAAGPHAEELGIRRVGGPESRPARDAARLPLLELAGDGVLTVRIAGTYPLEDAARAHRDLAGSHPPGKFVLLP
ncbi:NADP-dependent oxidoreductase [Rhodococcus sp. HNM0569]|uniref:NADP-dependent oxidoreductase n=1 Tax=Rhodococcus sp. HNM0569 TaxID=2716340 RepID=UPI00146D89DF|nr:NADP-dependent oxidoreductase [Rhodococcus sp. HNM0569]NLU82949.1 NADP-dependent oxidoreductase [Rhodococcus sp. HNM0569]